ncbi:hypothetical protein [Acetobacter sp.]|jgi:hypothetical protein|uniref:hypothetical protein n=1 Tax=Acetobacter sp. TaxID=440 RepID=UPI0025C41BBA|nr:hypothetical protein [Acetobacter sp.]MCH4090864.1 hypothetical protein [Acetobacter sp.]MCI1301052.1 hypothetical protein [Acetobacter sp.]MCI1317376.1 hypothetical protein [Acetobacter sp.]
MSLLRSLRELAYSDAGYEAYDDVIVIDGHDGFVQEENFSQNMLINNVDNDTCGMDFDDRKAIVIGNAV